MTKSSKLKLTLLGCASSCLINVAYADISFTDIPVIYDFNCGSDPISYGYTATNGGTDALQIQDLAITIANDDQLANIIDLVSIDPNDATTEGTCAYYQVQATELAAGASCPINVIIDPTVADLNCTLSTFFDDYLVDRDIVITWNDPANPAVLSEVTGPVDPFMGPLGAAAYFSALADTLEINDFVQVNQLLGAKHFHDHGFYDCLQGFNCRVTNQGWLDYALLHADFAYFFLKEAAYEIGAPVIGYTLPGHDDPITPGIYFFQDDYNWHLQDVLYIDGTLNFVGGRDLHYIFVIPSDAKVIITKDAAFQLERGIDPNNIIWVGGGEIIMESGAQAVGTWITKNKFIAENDGYSAQGLNALLEGRVLGLYFGNDEDDDHEHSKVILNGTSILGKDPHYSHSGLRSLIPGL